MDNPLSIPFAPHSPPTGQGLTVGDRHGLPDHDFNDHSTTERVKAPFRDAKIAPSKERGHRNNEKHDSPDLPVGGRLTHFLSAWSQTTTDEWSLEIVSQGYSIEFHSLPLDRFLPSPLATRSLKRLVVQQAIRHLFNINAIEPVLRDQRGSGVYSIFFTVHKKNGHWQFILNLKYMNQFIRLQHFHMESLKSITDALQQGEFMTSLDLTETYLHVLILPSHRRFLCFCVDEVHLQFKAPLWSFHGSQGFHQAPGESSRVSEKEGPPSLPLPGRSLRPVQFLPPSLEGYADSHGLPLSSRLPSQPRKE